MRIMTWNSLGMDGAKQALLNTYIGAQAIGAVFIQEGDPGYANPELEGHSLVSHLLLSRDSDPLNLLDACLPGRAVMAPVSGVGRQQTYNVVQGNAAFTAMNQSDVADYTAGNSPVKAWLVGPANFYATKRNATIKDKLLRKGRTWLPTGIGDINFKAALEQEITRPVQNRVNMLGHRRPKGVTMTVDGTKIFYWHAPLGAALKPEAMGFKTYADLNNCGCGGSLAVLANLVFAKHIGADTVFPDSTILVGDLNINRQAVEKIYHTDNVISSDDGWCHAVANPNLPLTSITTTLDTTVLGVSDHHPIVFDY